MSQSSYNYIANKQVRAALLLKREYTRSFFRGEITTPEIALIAPAATAMIEALPQYEKCLARTAEGFLAFEPLGRVTTRLTRHTYSVDLL